MGAKNMGAILKGRLLCPFGDQNVPTAGHRHTQLFASSIIIDLCCLQALNVE